MDIVYYRVNVEIRWDQIAYLAWGDTYLMDQLLEANQEIGVYQWIPKDAVIACPIDLEAAITPLLSSLPDWKL